MHLSLVARARSYVADAAVALRRAPVEVGLAVALASAFSYAVEHADVAMQAWFEVAVIAALMVASAWIATLLHALGHWPVATRAAITLAGAIAAGAYGFFVLNLELQSEAWRAAALLAAAVFLVIASPALAGRGEARTELVRSVTGRLLVRLIGVLLYAAALFAGLALALASVDNLFELNLRGTIYAHVFAWIFIVLVPWVVAGGIDAYAAPHSADSEVSGVLHRMSGYLVPPLLALYFAILFAYVLRIAVTGEVPKNLISPMVIAAGLLAAIALLLFDPRPERGSYRWLRVTPLLFLPLAALGGWAVLQRLEQHGWTEFRALRFILLLVLALVAALALVEVARRRRFSLYAAPLALALALLLAAIGPWNAQALAKRSQQGRLAAALDAAGVAAAEAPAEPRTIEVGRDVYDDVNSRAAYLASHFGPASLPPALGRHANAAIAHRDLAAAIGLRIRADDVGERPVAFARFARGGGAHSGTARYYRVDLTAERGPRGADPLAQVSAVQDGLLLRVRVDGQILAASLDAVERGLRGSPDARGGVLRDDAVIAVIDADGREAGRLIVLDIMADWQTGRFRVQQLDGLLVLAPR